MPAKTGSPPRDAAGCHCAGLTAERHSISSERALADFGAAELQSCPFAFAPERNELNRHFYRPPAGQLLRQRKPEAPSSRRIGDLELGVWEYAEPADLRLGFGALPLRLHNSLDATVLRRLKTRDDDFDAS